MTHTLRHKEIIRGKILNYLALIYPKAASLQLLQGELDIFGYPVPIEELNFHIAYMAEKKFVSVALTRGPQSKEKLPIVRITAKGIDYFDGRLPVDEGVYLEPRS